MSKEDMKKEATDLELDLKSIQDAASKTLNYLTTINISTIGFILAFMGAALKNQPVKPSISLITSLLGLIVAQIFLVLSQMRLFFVLFNKKQSGLKNDFQFMLGSFWVCYFTGFICFLLSLRIFYMP